MQMTNIFPLCSFFFILLRETFPQRSRYSGGLNICGKFQRTCLNIAPNEKDSRTTRAQNITSSVAHEFCIFIGAREYKDNRVRNTCILPLRAEERTVTDACNLFLTVLVVEN